MTAETPGYWHGRTWRIAAPVIVTNVSVPILGAVDTAVVGRLPGPEFVGAVAVGALIFNLLYHGCNFLRMGTTGLTAQSFGARDGSEVRTWMVRALMLGGAVGLLMVLLQWPIFTLSTLIVGPSDNVQPLVAEYFYARIWSAPAALANFALLGWFFGVQNTKAALITQVYMNGVNVVLDLWFVAGLGWGVAGVAWATVIAEVSALGVGLWLAAATLRKFGGRFDKNAIMLAAPLKRMLNVNRDIFIRSMCLQTVFVVLTAVGARMGDTVLAANAVLLQVNMFAVYALDGFANAAEALAGAALGARSRRQFDAAVRASSLWALIFALIFSLAIALLGEAAVDLLTTEPGVRAAAREYMLWIVLMPIVAVWSFQLDGIFIGCTWSRQMRNGMFIALIAYLIALGIFVPLFGNDGLWTGLVTLMVARAFTMGWMFADLRKQIPDDEDASTRPSGAPDSASG